MLLTDCHGRQLPPMADFSRRSQCLVPLYQAGGACDSSECPADVAAAAGRTGLQQLVGLGQGIIKRHESSCEFNLARPFTPTYVWQTDPPLPAKIVID
jgi:hypothetical protein